MTKCMVMFFVLFQYVTVQVNPDQIMAFGGSTAPCAICTVFNLGRLKNGEFTKHVMEKINKDLEIPTERLVFPSFVNIQIWRLSPN